MKAPIIKRVNLKSGAKGLMPALLVAAALMLSVTTPVWADKTDNQGADNKSSGEKTLAGVLHDTYWRWLYGNTTLPTDENGHAVLNGIALMPLPNTPGDGSPGSIDVTLRAGQPFFLPLFGLQGTSYTDGTPPDPFVDLSIYKTLAITFTIDGKTVVATKNVMDFYAQSMFVPPLPFPYANLDSIIWFQSIGVLGDALAPGKHVLKLDMKNTKPLPPGFGGAFVEYHNTFNITVSPRVVPPTEQFKGKTVSEWSAKWQQWALEFPVNQPSHPHPTVDSPQFDVRDRQSGDVWFLAAPFGTVERNITISSTKALLFPLLNVEVSNLEAGTPFYGATETAQRDQAKILANHIVNPFCTIDGVVVGPASSYRVSSPQFSFNAPSPWINSPAPGGKGQSVGDGYYILVEPMNKGEHTIHYGGTFHFDAGEYPDYFGPGPTDVPLDMTYHVTVK